MAVKSLNNFFKILRGLKPVENHAEDSTTSENSFIFTNLQKNFPVLFGVFSLLELHRKQEKTFSHHFCYIFLGSTGFQK